MFEVIDGDSVELLVVPPVHDFFSVPIILSSVCMNIITRGGTC